MKTGTCLMVAVALTIPGMEPGTCRGAPDNAAGAVFAPAAVGGETGFFAGRPARAFTQATRRPALPAMMANEMARGWQYCLLPGSQLIDRCPPCGRPDIPIAMRGSFRLRWVGGNPLFDEYLWEDICWKTEPSSPASFRITGHGRLWIGGEVAITQNLFVDAWLDDGLTNRHCFFTGAVFAVERPWPMIQFAVDQTNGTPFQQFHLDLFAAPFREIWFSTRHGFHAGIWNAPTNYVSPGDLVSSAGRVVQRNQELTTRLGIMPLVPDLGLDAVGVLSRGEMAFSIEDNIFSESLGMLRGGDILSANGRVITHGASLAGAFGPEPPPAEEGLDAMQFMTTGEIFFSVTNDFFSERLGRTIRRGDLLASGGRVVKGNEELVARFNPAEPGKDYGLDAIQVWPWGEVWFSVETGFYGQHFDFYGPGDLLSDQGYVVYRNLDLLSPFQPLEDLADFGLDALLVINDTEVPAATTGGVFTAVEATETGAGLLLRGESTGRLHQIEKAPDLSGPWTPLTPVTLASTNLGFIDRGTLTNLPRAFYRMLVW